MRSSRLLFSPRWEMRLWGFLLSQYHSRSGGSESLPRSSVCRVGNVSSFSFSLAAFQKLFITHRQWKIVLSLWALRPAEPCLPSTQSGTGDPKRDTKPAPQLEVSWQVSGWSSDARWVGGREGSYLKSGKKRLGGGTLYPHKCDMFIQIPFPSLKSREEAVCSFKRKPRCNIRFFEGLELHQSQKTGNFLSAILSTLRQKCLKTRTKSPTPTDPSLPPPHSWWKIFANKIWTSVLEEDERRAKLQIGNKCPSVFPTLERGLGPWGVFEKWLQCLPDDWSR